jgi:amidophosphoribosyltransferase
MDGGRILMKEECGVFGAFVQGELETKVFEIAKTVLFHLQHRGQEAAGIVISDGKRLKQHKGIGLVQGVFANGENYKGQIAIGHVRYSTRGRSDLLHAQPLIAEYLGHEIAIAHNGQLDNADEIRKNFEKQGTIFITRSDTEIFLHVLTRNLRKPPIEWSAKEIGEIFSKEISGSYSLAIATANKLMIFRDPKGYRPLFYSKVDDNYFFASEDSALKIITPEEIDIKEVEQGSYFEISKETIEKGKFSESKNSAHCFFEFVYFARPDSNIFGHSVHVIREELGKLLAKEKPVEADIVVPVMDSGFSASLGYSKQSKIPLELGLVRNHWVGRTFIKPQQSIRQQSVKNKLHPIERVIKNNRVVLVDDSLVRGTTMKEIVNMVRLAGAREVHVAIASPPVKYPCYWGIDIPTSEELVASNKTIEEIKNEIGCDSLAYVSLKGIKELLGDEYEKFCLHCFNGRKK